MGIAWKQVQKKGLLWRAKHGHTRTNELSTIHLSVPVLVFLSGACPGAPGVLASHFPPVG